MMNDDKYCIFRRGSETLGVPALAIRGVTPAGGISRLPLSHDVLAGLANIHKEIVPVFELSRFTGGGDLDEPSQVMVLNSDSGPWGLLIDQVLGLESLEVSFNGGRPDDVSWSACCIGSASCGDHFVTVLDRDALHALLAGDLRLHWDHLDSGGATRELPPCASVETRVSSSPETLDIEQLA